MPAEKTEKEIAFEAEYKALLEKYNVELVLSPWVDKYGYNTDISFVERGKYCNINYKKNPHQSLWHGWITAFPSLP